MAKRTDKQIMHGIFFDTKEDKETFQMLLWNIKNKTRMKFPDICINAMYAYYKELDEKV